MIPFFSGERAPQSGTEAMVAVQLITVTTWSRLSNSGMAGQSRMATSTTLTAPERMAAIRSVRNVGIVLEGANSRNV
jgi:hypothetical protein